MAKTFTQMVGKAQAAVLGIDVAEAQRRVRGTPGTLVVDVSDLANRRASGRVEGAIPVAVM